MDNGRTYTHPLSGDVHAGAGRVESANGVAGNWPLTCAIWAVAFLLGLAVVGGCGVTTFQYFRPAQAAREAVTPTIEYEPMSKVNDGSYTEEAGGGKAKSLGVLRRLRSR
jgi:hypothetical protein